jgi:hypothetical protein
MRCGFLNGVCDPLRDLPTGYGVAERGAAIPGQPTADTIPKPDTIDSFAVTNRDARAPYAIRDAVANGDACTPYATRDAVTNQDACAPYAIRDAQSCALGGGTGFAGADHTHTDTRAACGF